MTAVRQERLERLRLEFDEIDSNHDQQLSFKEIKDFLSMKSGEQFDPLLCQELFASLDKDRNAAVTVDEFILSYVQAEELMLTRIEQLQRQITDNTNHLTEAKRKHADALRTERTSPNGLMLGSVLTCHVREAKGLKPGSKLGSCNPYAVLTCEKQRIETKYIPDEVNPVWDEVFTFQIEHKDAILKIAVFDRSGDEFLGLVQLPLSSIDDQLKHDSYYELKGKNEEVKQGKIRLGLQWIWSKVSYFETIISQWESSLDMDRQELEHLQDQLRKLDKPFGLLVEAKSLKAITTAQPSIQLSVLERDFEVKFDNFVAQSLNGRPVDWDWASLLCLLVYLSLSVVTMFSRSAFADVRVTQVVLSGMMYYLWSRHSRDSRAYKALAVGIVISEVVDVLWFLTQGTVSVTQTWAGRAEAGSLIRDLNVLTSGIAFMVKVPLALVVWKVSMDMSRQTRE